MTSIYELRKIQRRLVVEHNRLDDIADALRQAKLSMSAVEVGRYAGALYAMSLSLGSIADAKLDPRGSRAAEGKTASNSNEE